MNQSSRSFELIVKAAPSLFVLFWSTGFIGTKYGLPYAEPLTFCAIRLLLATAAVAVLALIMRAPLPRGMAIPHNIVSGILVHGMYLSGVCVAIARGMPAGIAALIVGLQPILTSTLANRLLGERVAPLQWAGLLLGLGGLWLVVGVKAQGEAATVAWIAIIGSLVGITLGTLYQKRFGGGTDFLSAMPVQYAAAFVYSGVLALFFEQGRVEWTPELVFSLAWLVIVLSGGAILLLYFMIRRAEATRVASLFYLTPAVTSVMSWLLFDERLGLAAIAGIALCAAGVLLVNWKTAPAAS